MLRPALVRRQQASGRVNGHFLLPVPCTIGLYSGRGLMGTGSESGAVLGPLPVSATFVPFVVRR